MIPANISFKVIIFTIASKIQLGKFLFKVSSVRRNKKKERHFSHKPLTYIFLGGVDGVYLWFL